MRKAIMAAVALTFASFAPVGPASADPARVSSASAYGLSATGLVSISPTILTDPCCAQPPDSDIIVPPKLVNIPLGSLALAGVVGVDAHAHRADDLVPQLAGVPTTNLLSEPTTLVGNNAQGFAKTAGAALVFNAGTNPDPITTALALLLNETGGLLGADAISAEAAAKCVNGAPVFDTGFQIVGLGGLVGAPLNPLAQTLLGAVLALLPEGSTLSSIISITPGEVIPLPDGIAINGLRIRVPLLNEDIIISHAEAHMPTNCAVEVAAQPTGPGPVAPVGPRGQLASTGSNVPFLPIGLVMVTMAAVGTGIARRSRRTSTI
ncbi:MAG: hypothetical protein LC799_26055 [Actinobacteria bacterium]|nr:hypothetical protein [Actinomycetota bacterium]